MVEIRFRWVVHEVEVVPFPQFEGTVFALCRCGWGSLPPQVGDALGRLAAARQGRGHVSYHRRKSATMSWGWEVG